MLGPLGQLLARRDLQVARQEGYYRPEAATIERFRTTQ